MTSLDISTFQNMTGEQFVAYSHSLTAIPSMIILWILTMVLFLAIGLPMVNQKRKFLTIFVAVFLSSGILLIAMIFLPNVVHDFVVWIKSFFSL